MATIKRFASSLQQYGDLEVEASVGETCLNTLLSEIMKSTLVSYFSQEAGRTLYRIGSCYLEFISLVMDASGRVYRYMDMTCQNTGGINLYLIASSGEEAVRTYFGIPWRKRGHRGGVDSASGLTFLLLYLVPLGMQENAKPLFNSL